MPHYCALNCKNRGTHMFPKDPNRRKQWENAIQVQIKNFKASETARICGLHFEESDYFGRSKYTDNMPLAKFLKKTAVPSIFFFKPDTPAAQKRKRCYKKRGPRKYFKDVTLQSSTSDPTDGATVTKIEVEPLKRKAIKVEVLPAVGREEELSMPSETLPSNPQYECKSTQTDHECYIYISIDRFKEDDSAIKFYTGFETYRKFNFVYSTLSPMADKIQYYSGKVGKVSLEDQFFMTMMKLRQNKCNYELSKFFCISEPTSSNIFITWINFIYQLWSKLNIWHSKELVESYMPDNFKKCDKTRVTYGPEIDRKSQLPELAIKPIPIERIIGLTKTYKILKSVLDHSYSPIAHKIFFVCYMCCYFREYTEK